MSASASIPPFDAVRREAEAEAAVASLPLDTLSRLGVHLPIERYYLVGTYPPLKAMHQLSAAEALRGLSPSCNVYLHIPFCEQGCTFCHFSKEILPPWQRVARYVDALQWELGAVEETAGRRILAETVYFGGGTPSYLHAEQIAALFGSLRQHLRQLPGCEVTFELHPSIIDAPDYADRLQALMEAGVNRWVFGAQSMNDKVLKKLNRGHDRQAVHRLLAMLGERGLDNYSVDLIFGLPYQTLEDWYETLSCLIRAGVTVESGRLPVWRGIHLDSEERMRRTVMFSLRSGGVDRAGYRRRYGADVVDEFERELRPLADHGLLTIDDATVRLTDRGAPFADGIALRFASEKVVRRVRDANARIVDLKRDPVDRYDFSPIGRAPVGAGFSPSSRRSRRPRAQEKAPSQHR